jgi:recombination protein RecA
VVEAQRSGEPVAWVSAGRTTFFPPDLADAGVDLGALPVVPVDELMAAAQVADELLRSGAFGLLVLDVGETIPWVGSPAPARGGRGRHIEVPRLALSVETRLAGLAQKHHAAVVFLTATPRTAPSVGTLVSLRAEGRLRRVNGGDFHAELQVVKDKERGPGWRHHEVRRGPDGLA